MMRCALLVGFLLLATGGLDVAATPVGARDRGIWPDLDSHPSLLTLLGATPVTPTPKPTAADRDGDGIPNRLDVVLGAEKTVLNADRYEGGYLRIDYPMGDVPRAIGVCTDVVVRALRNAGIDLQREVHRDIQRARRSDPRAYPMVRGRGDTNIDHRRVKTLVVYFLRHWERHATTLEENDPWLPGDVVLMDTFPSRPGPDHIGIVSHRRDPSSGRPLIVNNWSDGTVTAEMDLLGFVPITHRFRVPE